ncbi:UNVERIFIED_CONTAM: hypothetical protein PYX00_011771 [Menopon gallinae]|uniref:SCD domain-containing protein n=1 Tax=Menopon gallinae TaxID=328185 RepID=A0AAW2H8C8_9NEOP
MDLTATGLGGLLNAKTKHQVKVSGLIQKLCEISRFVKDSLANHKKLIIDSYDRVVLTAQPQKIFTNINIPHPIVKLLVNDIEKINTKGDSAMYYMLVVASLLNEVGEIMNRGVYPKALHAVLLDVRDRVLLELEKVERKSVARCGPAAETGAGEAPAVDSITRETERMRIEEEDASQDRESGAGEHGTHTGCLEFMRNKHLEKLVWDALKITGRPDNIRVFKVNGGCLPESYVVNGMVFGKSAAGLVKEKSSCRTAIYNCPVDITLTETKGNILFSNADEMLSFSSSEEARVRKFVDSIRAGAVFCNGTIGNMHLDFMNARNILVFKVQSKFDLARIREICGGSISQRLVQMDEGHMGRLERAEMYYEGGRCYTKFIGSESRIATIVLKDPLMVNCDEYEREIENCLRAIKSRSTGVVRAGDVAGAAGDVLEGLKKECSNQNRIIYTRLARVFGSVPDIPVLYEGARNHLPMGKKRSPGVLEVLDAEKENELCFSNNSTMSIEKESSVYLGSVASNECSIDTASKTHSLEQRAGPDDNARLAPIEVGSFAADAGPAGGAAAEHGEPGRMDWTDAALLERHPADSIASALREEGFDAFLALLRSSAVMLKKQAVATLLKILNAIPVDVQALVRCTTDSMRNMRYASTFLCCELAKARASAPEGPGVLLDDVLVRRHRDVDPNIRSLCVASLADVLAARPEFVAPRYLEIFAKSMADKNEAVRRKSARAMKKMLGTKTKASLKAFYMKNMRVIRELAQFDRSEAVKSECAGLLFLLYKSKFVKKEACYSVLHMADRKTFWDIFNEVCGDLRGPGRGGKGDVGDNVLLPIDVLHELLDINEKAFALLDFSQENLNEYIEDTMRDLSCVPGCRRTSACRLKILSLICLPNTPPRYFAEILAIVKESPENVGLVLECLMRASPKAECEGTDEIVRTVFNLNRNFENRLLGPFLRLLKQIGGAVAAYYVDMVLCEETCVEVAKYFDVSHFESRNVLFQCYCFLWRAICGDFREAELDGGFDEDLSGLLNFLVFFKERTGDSNGMRDAIRAFYSKLEDYVRRYVEARSLSIEELSELARLAKKGILADTAGPARKDFIKEKMLGDFFAKLLKSRKLDRALAKKVARETRGISAFDHLKSCVGSDVEGVCEFFVSGLSLNEAIYLENKSHTKKIKSVLLRKINSKRKSDFPSSPVRENEDVLSL